MSSVFKEGYEVPESSGSKFLKFEKGDNRFRILSEVLTGSSYWKETEDGKRPVRVPEGQAIDVDDVPAGVNPRHFWAVVVWDHQKEQIGILEITQVSVQRELKALDKNPKWGDLRDYDIVVTRTGEGKDSTKYTVMPEPKEELSKSIMDEYSDMEINLEALFTNGDPFAGGSESSADEDIDVDVKF